VGGHGACCPHVLPVLRLAVGGHNLALSSQGLAIAAGVTAAAFLVARRAPVPGSALLALAAGAPAALVGAHALFYVMHGGMVGVWSGGLASIGGLFVGFAAAAAMALVARRPVLEIFDALAPAALLALAIGRLGCFLGGCCYGRPTTLAWGVVFPDLGPPPRHPLQLYSAAGDLAVLLLLPPADAPRGAVTRRAAILFGLLRAMLEPLRDPAATDHLAAYITLPQAAALTLAGVAVIVPRLRPARPLRRNVPDPH
jgi:phosphatidylglycerol:prolipoprotein diacylglycerol transferase